ncbi:hypothetical protein AOXY_G7543 [Acipenser oxyrinchus oxyrinchus]|uniref:Uncharacterized protein n=1 Tax=Acipenser oxyrinchus oxyrinchus TaxID=40147 RepID=A0AAD8GAF9_ACIOX|nr:hypothetical protein AOXY_G7543 [Acipenser oxyrinchus oxyrinchus]
MLVTVVNTPAFVQESKKTTQESFPLAAEDTVDSESEVPQSNLDPDMESTSYVCIQSTSRSTIILVITPVLITAVRMHYNGKQKTNVSAIDRTLDRLTITFLEMEDHAEKRIQEMEETTTAGI